jgi:hypothetical protein
LDLLRSPEQAAVLRLNGFRLSLSRDPEQVELQATASLPDGVLGVPDLVELLLLLPQEGPASPGSRTSRVETFFRAEAARLAAPLSGALSPSRATEILAELAVAELPAGLACPHGKPIFSLLASIS